MRWDAAISDVIIICEQVRGVDAHGSDQGFPKQGRRGRGDHGFWWFLFNGRRSRQVFQCILGPFSSVPPLSPLLLKNTRSTLPPSQAPFLSTPLPPTTALPSSSHPTSVLFPSAVAALISSATTTTTTTTFTSSWSYRHPVISATRFRVLPSATMAVSGASSHCYAA